MSTSLRTIKIIYSHYKIVTPHAEKVSMFTRQISDKCWVYFDYTA